MKVLITAGPTIEPIDPVRCITNFASGRLGILIALEAKKRGHDVHLIYGHGKVEAPTDISCSRFTNAESLLKEVVSRISWADLFISSAAVSDYTPVEFSSQKIESANPLTIHLKPTPKIIKIVREKANPNTIFVAFKLAYDVDKDELVKKAISSYGDVAKILVANDLKNIDGDRHRASIILGNRVVKEVETKQEIAEAILDYAENIFINLAQLYP